VRSMSSCITVRASRAACSANMPTAGTMNTRYIVRCSLLGEKSPKPTEETVTTDQ